MISLISIYAGGILTLLMAVFHTRFYTLFKWQEEFDKISSVNRRILYTIHIFLTLIFLLIGILSLSYAKELSQCIGIAFGFNLLIAIFWLARTIWQVFYFKGGKLMHYALIIYFFLLFVSYILPVVVKMF